MPNPTLSIITVNYNGQEDTCCMLSSLKNFLPQNLSFEAIIVDNASAKDETDFMRSSMGNDPRFYFIRTEKNLGFAGGNNLGARAAKGSFLFFLNNDTEITDNSIIHLCAFLQQHPQAGCVMPKICFFEAPQKVQSVGFTPLSRITLRNTSLGFNQENGEKWNELRQTPYVHGAAMMIPRQVWEKVGPMPEFYFLYYEELDYSLMLRRAGYSLWCEPRCSLLHKESQSVGNGSPLKVFYLTRNRLLFAYRNLQGLEKYASLLFQLCVSLPKLIAKNGIKKDVTLVRAGLKGAIDFFRFPKKNIHLL